MTEKKGLLVGEVATRLGPISLVPVDTGIVHVHGIM